ncbi:MAG TPA: hypothetical protein VN455_13125 [Methanotrichaceae archaeon]|nr:hypothetical protein [Methanotrichaceae archaeon]
MSDLDDLQRSVEAVQGLIGPMKGGEFADKLGKVSVYAGSVARSFGTCSSILATSSKQKDIDPGKHRKAVEGQIRALRSSTSNSLKFARMNLDQAVTQALEMLAPRPRSATRVEEHKRMESLLRWFDGLDDPDRAMLDHYRSTSHPLDKYLLAGPWGFERLKKSNVDLPSYYRDLWQMHKCSDPQAMAVVLGYSDLAKALDALDEAAKNAADALERVALSGSA